VKIGKDRHGNAKRVENNTSTERWAQLREARNSVVRVTKPHQSPAQRFFPLNKTW
jgi:hypothetical protein